MCLIFVAIGYDAMCLLWSYFCEEIITFINYFHPVGYHFVRL